MEKLPENLMTGGASPERDDRLAVWATYNLAWLAMAHSIEQQL
jgi:hypothetical protein